ncbi:MAG: hypothetical protein HRT67_05980 [Flavobacteriaceae bacterium]|nr:hypothetical protein [Flavobacteriaceae bacterium]
MLIKKIIFTFLVFLALISCGFKEEKPKQTNRILDSSITEFTFPDSVYINENFYGHIKYDSSLDSLNLDDIDTRFTLFYLTNEKEVSSLDEIKKLKHNVFIDTTGSGHFSFKIIFDKYGENILSGVVEDKIFFKQTDENESFLIRTKETIVTKDIRVIKRPLNEENKI